MNLQRLWMWAIQAQILELIKELQQKNNMAVIMITHDLGVIAEFCDRVAVMYAGKVVETASVVDVFKNGNIPTPKDFFHRYLRWIILVKQN